MIKTVLDLNNLALAINANATSFMFPFVLNNERIDEVNYSVCCFANDVYLKWDILQFKWLKMSVVKIVKKEK